MILLVFLLFLTFTEARCPSGSIQGLYASDCYKFFSTPVSFPEAETNCQNLNGHLASVLSSFENSFLFGEAEAYFGQNKVDFWLGGTTLLTPGNWSWTGGSQWIYANWAKGQPGTFDDSNCVAQNLMNGLWFNNDCSLSKPYVCKLNGTSEEKCSSPSTIFPPTAPTCKQCSPSCPSEWTYYEPTQQCYLLIRNYTFGDADKECNSKGGQLASVHNLDVNNFLAGWSSAGSLFGNILPQAKQIFLGLYKTGADQPWLWKDGTAVDFTNWQWNEPDDGGGVQWCGTIITDLDKGEGGHQGWVFGKWDDLQCYYACDAICQRPINV